MFNDLTAKRQRLNTKAPNRNYGDGTTCVPRSLLAAVDLYAFLELLSFIVKVSYLIEQNSSKMAPTTLAQIDGKVHESKSTTSS